MYIKTEKFRFDLDRTVDVLRSRGYKEEWIINTPFQAEAKMYNILQNKFACLREEANQTIVDYTRGE